MSKRIRVGQTTYVVPDDATDDEITQIVDGQATAAPHAPAQEPERPGLLSTLGGDLWNMAKGLPQAAVSAMPGIGMAQEALPESVQKAVGYTPIAEDIKSTVEREKERKSEGYSLPYRIAAPVAERLGVNVSGMEQSAQQGDTGGVVGHALAVPTAMATTAGIAKGAPEIARAIPRASAEVKPLATAPIRYAARAAETAVNQKLLPVKPILNINTPADAAEAVHVKVPGRDLGLPKPSQAEGLPEVEAARPEATAALRARIATERNLRNQEPFPRVSEGLPEVEAGQPEATNLLRKAVAPNPPGPRIATSPKRVGTLLDESVGAKPLNPKVPLRNQLDNVTPVQPKESSVVKSHTYDPNAQEMTVHTHNGGGYIHGDVTPEQAQAFESAESKGKAWNQLKNNSTLVAKIVNGKRVAIAPTGPRVATPDDLTPVLEDSVKAVKARKSFGKK